MDLRTGKVNELSGLFKSIGLKVLKKKCPIHHCHLVSNAITKKPYCPKCNEKHDKAKWRKEDKAASRKLLLNERLSFLRDNSVINDVSIGQANFSNFMGYNSVVSKCKSKAEKIAKRYVKYFDLWHTFPKSRIFMEDANSSTIISGASGRGKSHIAMAILKYVCLHTKHPVNCLFIDLDRMIQVIENSFESKDPVKQRIENSLDRADIIVLDDLGNEEIAKRIYYRKQTSKGVKKEARYRYPKRWTWAQQLMFDILNRHKAFIITTNLSHDELKAAYNPKLYSRIMRGLKHYGIRFPTKFTCDHRMLYQSDVAKMLKKQSI